MVEANVKIIEELKWFLEEVSSNPEFRKEVTRSENDFSRDRKLTMERIVGFVINLPKRSLSIELREFFEGLDTQVQTATKGAFSQQRIKLKPLFFQAWNKWLVDSFYHYYGSDAKYWKGFRLQAVDGSTVYLMDRPEVVTHFGTHANQFTSIPMARVMQIEDVLNGITVWGDIRPIAESESSIMASLVSGLHPESLTIFDRGFPSYTLMYLMMNQETPRHFAMRCKVGFNKDVKRFVLSKENSKTITMTPNAEAIKTLRKYGYVTTSATPIKVRMVKIILTSGETEVLLTNLYNEEQFTVKDLYLLYGLRWRIETKYDTQKNQQQMEQFSGHRVICIQQDYQAGLFTANLQSLIEKQCDGYLEEINKKREHNYKINKNVSWASLKHNIVKLFLENEPEAILSTLQMAFQQNLEPIRLNRHIPRKIKNKRLLGKYQTFTNYRRAV